MPDSTSAVFLSYASDDAIAARRLAEALRRGGIEVWFDQEELRGGDAWDRRIRTQIQTCSIFIPLISHHSERRKEGYFRREWSLAVDRTRDLAEDVVFLLPVVIDDTTDTAARVPDKFRETQWTRMPGGEPTVDFCHRVHELLARNSHTEPPTSPRPRRLPRRRTWWRNAAVVTAAVAALLGAVWLTRQIAGSRPDLSPWPGLAQRELAQARQLFAELERGGRSRENLDLAEALCEKAVQLDPASADAWALGAEISAALWALGYDVTPARWGKMNTQARRAIALAPGAMETRFAYATALATSDHTRAEAEHMLRALVAEHPAEKRFLRRLANTLPLAAADEALALFDRAAALPGGDPEAVLAQAGILLQLGRDREADAAVDRALAQQPSEAAYIRKFQILVARGDLAEMRDVVTAIPPALLRNDSLAYCAALTWLGSRKGAEARAVLANAPGDYFSVSAPILFEGPKAYLEGLAFLLDDSQDAARAKWESALGVLERHLVQDPSRGELLVLKAELLVRLGKKADALAIEHAARQLNGEEALPEPGIYKLVFDTLMDRREEVITALERMKRAGRMPKLLRALLRHDLRFDSLRNDPRFAALLEPDSQAPALAR